MTNKSIMELLTKIDTKLDSIELRVSKLEASTTNTKTSTTKKLSAKQKAVQQRRATIQGEKCITAVTFKELMAKNGKTWDDVSSIYESHRTSYSLEGKQKAYFATANELGWL